MYPNDGFRIDACILEKSFNTLNNLSSSRWSQAKVQRRKNVGISINFFFHLNEMKPSGEKDLR